MKLLYISLYNINTYGGNENKADGSVYTGGIVLWKCQLPTYLKVLRFDLIMTHNSLIF